MRVIVLRDYPEELGHLIDLHLKTDFTVNGYYGDRGLEWVIEYRGSRDTTILELALSEYILDMATVDTVWEYRIRQGKGAF
jgi:hypothetical protein